MALLRHVQCVIFSLRVHSPRSHLNDWVFWKRRQGAGVGAVTSQNGWAICAGRFGLVYVQSCHGVVSWVCGFAFRLVFGDYFWVFVVWNLGIFGILGDGLWALDG